ncbi:MAG TPA: DUF2442 domain-containing protein [Verrucomicrobiae bacterium]|nr:DUF2442 domain-containing protein [Verrucomicrobiae bacterium]
MKLSTLGTNTLAVEITHISAHGVWLMVKGREHFLSYEDFPWFKEAKLRDILDVKLLHATHLYWPKLDVDLSLKSVQDPGAYPLIAK